MRDHDEKREENRERRCTWHRAGLCIYCGRQPHTGVTKSCAQCRHTINSKQRERDARRRTA